MENSNKIIPPHLNAEVYRTDTTGTNTLSYLDYIRIHSDGSFLVGCSELTGRYWNGSACIFKSAPGDHKFQSESKKNINLKSGTADGCFIEYSDKVLLCEDSGTVSVWSTNNEGAWKQWNEQLSAAEHDDGALSVDCLEPGQEYITVGADGNVKVWDINEMLCVRSYNAAHSLAINDVSVRPNGTKNFATGSLDRYMTLWDENVAKPVQDLVKNDCSIRCLKWLDENCLLYGDEAGILSLLDIRNPDATFKMYQFPAAVHKLALQADTSRVAVCCDNKITTVCCVTDDNQVKCVYSDMHMHSNYVRGLAWDINDKNILYSLGWDGELKTHRVTGS